MGARYASVFAPPSSFGNKGNQTMSDRRVELISYGFNDQKRREFSCEGCGCKVVTNIPTKRFCTVDCRLGAVEHICQVCGGVFLAPEETNRKVCRGLICERTQKRRNKENEKAKARKKRRKGPRTHKHKCEQCGKVFTSKSPRSKFCEPKCKHRSKYQEKKAGR